MIPLKKVQKQAKLIYGDKVRLVITYRASRKVLTGKKHEGVF